MAEKLKKLTKRAIALITAGAIAAAILLTVLGMFIAYWYAQSTYIVWRPPYQMLSREAITAIYNKEQLDEADYQTLFEQTGLTKIGIDRARAQSGGLQRVISVQQSYFTERSVLIDEYLPLMCTAYIQGPYAVAGYLERGDIVVSSSTLFAGLKIGHSAVITSPVGQLFQSNSVGQMNGYNTFANMFTRRINFMVLRINPLYFSSSGQDDAEYAQNLNRAVSFIETELVSSPYNPLAGFLTKKDGMRATTCAHMIWYGYKHFDDLNGGRFNLDLDSNGGPLVLPRDISLSPYVEIVQIFGFDPAVLYD